jgi:hypothetical protein
LTVTDGANGNFSRFMLQLTFTGDPALPVISSSSSAPLNPGKPFMYTIKADAPDPSDPPRYYLQFTLPPGLVFDSNTGTISGINPQFGQNGGPKKRPDLSGGIVITVQLFAYTHSHGVGTVPLNFFLAPEGAVEIASRVAVGTGDNVLIGGFIVRGDAPKKVLIRAIGPSLTQLGVPNALADPVLDLHGPGAFVTIRNDNWRDDPLQEAQISDTGIPPTNNLESAILAYLSPGAYTAIVSGKNNTTGVADVEVYDLSTALLDPSGNARLADISTRGFVQTGDNAIFGGFIVVTQPTRIVIRAIGPSLTQFGVPDALVNPELELYDATSLIAQNDDWQTTQIFGIITSNQVADIQASQLAPTNPAESAIIATLQPGLYTAVVRGVNNNTGNAVVEVYSLLP